MDKREERNKKFYTEKGIKALEKRMDNLINLFNNHKFPFSAQVFGFGKLDIKSKEECLSRIKELSDLTGKDFRIKTTVSKDTDGNEDTKEVIENGSRRRISKI